ncbi:DUF4260 domain-containing protein [Pedobacter sp. GR22-10]|uniref:DUF4260 domain-containing protein n=1 Tax=Pedobacter sp. GR22-10 TaxID=2994472 RepID=UPI0022471B0C|nr:DUF4260 domain-containing protein [Pedobacter sp. GR22-10]MCX2430196.1 DUF4260 domain-containing protein [Pedobacter sp. GR22-10]
MNHEKTMAVVIKIEEAAITAVAIYFLTKYHLGLSVWLWVLLFFAPDLSMLGYLVNSRIGAFTYNLFHHRAVAIGLLAAGFMMHMDILISIGLLLAAHSSFDRMLGYGLKFSDNFKHTSSGWIGKGQ